MERARAAGAVGLIATLDWSFSHGRDWGSPNIPEQISNQLRWRPRASPGRDGSGPWPRPGSRPTSASPTWCQGGQAPPSSGCTASGCKPRRRVGKTWPGSASMGRTIHAQGHRPARRRKRAVDAGVSAISVSNHGGNNLDGTPATIRALARHRRCGGRPDRGAARRRRAPGWRRRESGRSGARAVMIGRAYLWGLAANGQAGVENVLDLMRSGFESAMLGLGHTSAHELSPSDLVIPEGFTASSAPERLAPGGQSSNLTTPRTIVPAAWSS